MRDEERRALEHGLGYSDTAPLQVGRRREQGEGGLNTNEMNIIEGE